MSQVIEISPVSDRQTYERGDVLCKVEVDCRVLAQALPGGYMVGQGKQIIRVRKADLPAIQSLVETEPQEIEAARKRHTVLLEKHIEEGMAGIQASPEASLIRRRQLEAEYPGSLEAIFYRDMNRSIRPLISVNVVEDNLPTPVDETSVDHQRMLASVIAEQLAKTLIGLNLGNGQQQKKS